LIETNETNNKKGSILYSNNCALWNPKNFYGISLAALGLEAPEDMGYYNLSMMLSYNGKIMGQNSQVFEVTKRNTTGHHHVCNSANQCIQVAGSGNNDCGSTSDCLRGGNNGNYTCVESWVFDDSWTQCIDSMQTRVCYDQRNCGTIRLKPATCIWDGTRYVETISCQSNPCTEDWQCEWRCMNTGQEIKVCTDVNNCGTQQFKPAEESRPCKTSIFKAWWFWGAIAAILIAVFLLILFLVILPNAKKKKKTEKHELEEEDIEKEEKEKSKKNEAAEAAGEKEEEAQSQDRSAADALKTYVKDAKAAGMSKDEIEEKLVGAGWPKDAVDEAVKTF
jgi:hypothetical protein